MRAFNRAKALLGLEPQTALLFMEAYVRMGMARLTLRFRPFAKIAPSLGGYMKESDSACAADERRTLIHISQAIHIVSRHTFWESKCLVRAVAGMRMLESRGIDSTLYLGTAKNEDGRLIAHAWLRSGSHYITGAEEMSRFTVTGTFAKVKSMKDGMG